MRQHKTAICRTALAENLAGNKPDLFWNKVKTLNNNKIALLHFIDGVTGYQNITNMYIIKLNIIV